MSRTRTLIAASLVAGAPLLAGCGSTVEAGERALRLRPLTAGLEEKVNAEGFYWHLPWNDYVAYDVRWRSPREKIEVLTRDDLHIVVEASATLTPDYIRFKAFDSPSAKYYFIPLGGDGLPLIVAPEAGAGLPGRP